MEWYKNVENSALICLGLFFSTDQLQAATAGLLYTEDFATTKLIDVAKTSANWSTADQAVYLAWQNQWHPHRSDSVTAVANIATTIEISSVKDTSLALIIIVKGLCSLYLKQGKTHD